MSFQFIPLDRTNTLEPLYVQIYNGFRNAIEEEFLHAKDRMPSIRSLAESLSVSKITVEMAYDQLYSEGYIEKNNRARYTVAPISFPSWEESKKDPPPLPVRKQPHIRYNFGAGEMDLEGFDFNLWRRYLNRGVENPSRLIAYGDLQGEWELREELAQYLFRSRGVEALPEQIVVGANTQVLLGILSSLLDRKKDRIAFEDPGFKLGRQVFANYGFPIFPITMTSQGIQLESLAQSEANIAYISPSHQFPTGTILSIGKRVQLLEWAQQERHLIIEDDYDSEFRYYGNPIPALKSLDHHDNVVYLGSFSKILPPSLRVSYMLLPFSFLEELLAKEAPVSQSSSTVEQLALAEFMKDGMLDRQIRRLRKQYQEKRESFLYYLRKIFQQKITIYENQSGLFVVLEVHNHLSPQELKKRAADNLCQVATISDYALQETQDQRMLLYFSSIPLEEIENAVTCLYHAWF